MDTIVIPMKKILSLTALLLAFASLSWAYDFSAVAPTGQTLYYNISGSTVSVTYPGASIDDPYADYTGPTGALTIPSTVTYDNQTYSVTAIGNYAFADCYDLASVTIPNSVTSIGNRSFRYCFGLTSISIPNSVTSIGNRTFFGCSGLTSISIPNSVTSIGDWAFADCSSLATIVIPNSVTTIGNQLFFYCRSLTSVTIPNTVTSIGEWAFRGCSGLISITIPNSVTSIGGGAFGHCIGLTEITSLASEAPLLDRNVFFDVPSTISVYIPCGSIASYQSRWSDISNFVESAAIHLNATTADSTQGTVQVQTEPSCADPTAVIYADANTGYYFDHWSDGNTDNPRTIVLTSDTIITAYFLHVQEFTITVASADPSMGSATGSGSFPDGTITTITATANDGYRFVQWQDSITEPIRTITVTANATYTAYFEADDSPEGIAEAADMDGIVIRTNGTRIMVEDIVDETVRLFDCMGRCLLTMRATTNCTLQAPAPGVYMLQVSDHPAQRVVVLR